MIGILFFLFEFYDDQLLAFMVLILVWLCEPFTLVRSVSLFSQYYVSNQVCYLDSMSGGFVAQKLFLVNASWVIKLHIYPIQLACIVIFVAKSIVSYSHLLHCKLTIYF